MAQANNTGTTHFLQYGALAALSPQGDAFRATLLARCADGRDVVEDFIDRQNRVRWMKPDGAFYGFLHVDGLKDSLGFVPGDGVRDKVGVSPGSAFSLGDPRDDSYLRICFAQDAARTGGRAWADRKHLRNDVRGRRLDRFDRHHARKGGDTAAQGGGHGMALGQRDLHFLARPARHHEADQPFARLHQLRRHRAKRRGGVQPHHHALARVGRRLVEIGDGGGAQFQFVAVPVRRWR